MTIPLLKFTEYAENALSIYRNFYEFSKISKAFATLRIIAELLFCAIHCLIRTFHYMEHPQFDNNVMYFYLSNFNSALLIILGRYHSKNYKFLTTHLNFGCKFFNNDMGYLKNLKAKSFVFIGFVFVTCFVKVLLFGFLQVSTTTLPNLPPFWNYVSQLSMLMCDFRYIFEFLVLYWLLHIMSEQLLSVTRKIDNEDLWKTVNLIAEVDKWSILYKHIRASAELFNEIFGLQITVILSTTISYYIIYLYTMTSRSVLGKSTIMEAGMYIGTLLLMLVILRMVSSAAQAMENNADNLKRRICKLLLSSISNRDCESYKATKDLLRMMSTRPIRACAFGSLSVGMTLLPFCVSFFTTYTVIALQFNNVL